MRRNAASSALLQLTWNTFEKFLTSLGTYTDGLDKLFFKTLDQILLPRIYLFVKRRLYQLLRYVKVNIGHQILNIFALSVSVSDI